MSKVFSVRWLVHPLGLVLPLVAAAGMLSAARSVSASPVSQQPQVASLPAAGHELQVADEVIRELRRLGLNFAHDRVERPYDPKGEFC